MRDALHRLIAEAHADHDFERTDTLMLECPDSECGECGRICCPHGDTFHFHHDGCPSCSQPPVFCRKCGGQMRPGKALRDILAGTPDFPGGEVVTMSPGGKAELVDCLKCESCGHSISVER